MRLIEMTSGYHDHMDRMIAEKNRGGFAEEAAAKNDDAGRR